MVERGKAFADAGASGFFVPRLADPAQIERIVSEVPCRSTSSHSPARRDKSEWAKAGVARISHGPFPHKALMAKLTEMAQATRSLIGARRLAWRERFPGSGGVGAFERTAAWFAGFVNRRADRAHIKIAARTSRHGRIAITIWLRVLSAIHCEIDGPSTTSRGHSAKPQAPPSDGSRS